MSLSLIIPTKNEEERLGRFLSQLQKQTLSPTEIIIADSSTDKTKEIAKNLECKIVEGNGEGYIGKARNNAAKVAGSEILIFCDVDTILIDNKFLENAVEYFSEKNLDFASCYISTDKFNFELSTNLWATNISKRMGNYLEKPIGERENFMIFKKEVFINTGGFREDIKFGEGLEYFERLYKAGYKYGVIPLWIKTDHRKKSMFSRNVRLTFWGFVWFFAKYLPKKYSDKVYKICGDIYWE